MAKTQPVLLNIYITQFANPIADKRMLFAEVYNHEIDFRFTILDFGFLLIRHQGQRRTFEQI